MTDTNFPNIWPERWVEELRAVASPPRELMKPGKDGTGLWVGVERLVREGRGRISDDWEIFSNTQFPGEVAMMAALMRQMKDDGYAPSWYSQRVVSTYLTARWIQDGKRYYAVDDATANALMDTNFGDFPTDDLRFPLPSFWVSLPKTFRWPMQAGLIESEHAKEEQIQNVEGLLIGGMKIGPSGVVDHMRVLVCGRSKYPGEDAVLWYTCPFPRPTLSLISECKTTKELDRTNYKMYGAANWNPDTEVIGWACKFIVGLCLYLQMTHPQLRVHTPVPQPQVSRKKKHRETWAKYEASTRCHVTYVGGPEHGHERGTLPKAPTFSKRKSPRPHTRAGHFRQQPVGSREEGRREVRWIRPMRVGDWSTIFEWQEPVRTIFKTRPAEKDRRIRNDPNYTGPERRKVA